MDIAEEAGSPSPLLEAYLLSWPSRKCTAPECKTTREQAVMAGRSMDMERAQAGS